MGMGSAPCHTQVITVEVIEQIVPVEYKAFVEACEKEDIDLGTESENYAITCLKDGEYEELACEGDYDVSFIKNSYETLLEAFEKQTDMPLNINHLSEDDGGRYDDVDGTFWEIGRVYQLTPLAKQLKAKYGDDAIKDANYTIWC
jgi:hypothetical protein